MIKHLFDNNPRGVHSLESILVDAIREDKPVTIEELGGAAGLFRARQQLACSPLMPEFLEIALANLTLVKTRERTRLEAFAVYSLRNVVDAFSAQEAVDFLSTYGPLPSSFREKLFSALLSSASNESKAPITRGWCLAGAFSMALQSPILRHQLSSYLHGIGVEDEAQYIRYVAKIIGLSNSLWPDDDFVRLLESLLSVESAKAEIAFELGTALLAKSLDADNQEVAEKGFAAARDWYICSIQNEEQRTDAELYRAAIDLLFAFKLGQKGGQIEEYLGRLESAIAIYRAWHPSGIECLMTARNIEMAHWYTLAAKLHALSNHLVEESWFEPIIIIEKELLSVYEASRTIFNRDRSGGIDTTVRPRIQALLIRNNSLLSAFQKWLTLKGKALSPGAENLKREIDSYLMEHMREAKSDCATSDFLSSVQIPILGKDFMARKERSAIHRIMEEQVELQTNEVSPVLERMIEKCTNAVYEMVDYQEHRVASAFNTLLLHTLRYLENRMSLTAKSLPRLAFLFDRAGDTSLPHESELQEDYYQFMFGNVITGDISVEKSDIAGGRADVYFSFGTIKFVAETKRDCEDCSFEAIRSKYLGQAAEYQNTDVKLGFLLVLDLTKKPYGAGDMERHVKVEILKDSEESSERAVVVIRIPGRRRTPHAVRVKNG